MFQVVLLFQKYEFVVVYKPNHTHVVANAISRLPNTIKPTNVLDQNHRYNFIAFTTNLAKGDKRLSIDKTNVSYLDHHSKAKVSEKNKAFHGTRWNIVSNGLGQ
jgi:hypothetical protein